MVDELFSKRLPALFKSQDREDRKTSIQVSIEIHTSTTPSHRKDLVVRLTDESDLFFLFTLKLNEEDFQSLKVNQGLLVDFGAFPQKFIDLLELCIQEEHKENAKYILHFVLNGASSSSTANLNVIETNPFKHLTHLSLKFLPGSDTDVKKYLADCLKTLKDHNETLFGRLEHTESDLSTQLRQAREALATRTRELDSLRSEWGSKTSDITQHHKQEINSEKEKTLQIQTNVQQRHERERRELEQAHTKIVKQMESRIYEMETANKDLTDRKYKSESSIRELRSKLTLAEEENQRVKTELHNIRKDNAGLDANCHQQDKNVNQLKMRLAVVEQEVKDKEEVLNRTTQLLSQEQEQKRKSEEDLERKKRHVSKLETTVKTISDELVKGNEIIKKLQGDIKNYHTKLKLRSQVTTEQEKLLSEKTRDMEEMKHDLEQTCRTLRQREDENKKLNDTLETTLQKLEESKQLIRTNENVINWLNKQVTETQLSQGRHGPFEMTSSSATSGLKPGSALHNSSGQGSVHAYTATSGHMPLTAVVPRHTLPQIQYQPNQPRPSGLPVPLAKSSPIGTIPEEGGMARQSLDTQASPAHLSQKPANSDPFLDAKYLKQGDPPISAGRSASPNHNSAHSIHFSQGPAPQRPLPTTKALAPPATTRGGAARPNTVTLPHNPARLSKAAIIGPQGPGVASAARGSSQQTPPLASAYFPGQAKVS